jgi:hypothetical protein
VRGLGFTQRSCGRTNRVGSLSLAVAVLASAIWASSAFPAGPPIISGTAVSRISETSARLEGTINPNEREVKQYFFEYVDQAGFEAHGFTGASKTPTGTLPTGKEGVSVSAQLSGLKSGATYHFRLFAQNTAGKTEGPALAFTTFVTPPPFGSCSNDAFRGSSPSGALPDCRAYEQASPVDKNGGDLTGTIDYDHASASGDKISFEAYAPIPGAEGAQTFTPVYLGSRGAGGWSTQGLLPPQSIADEGRLTSWTPDFTHVFEWARLLGDPSKAALLDRNTLSGSVETIVPHRVGFLEPTVPGFSEDGSVVFFEDDGIPLLENAPKEKNNLYVRDPATGAHRLAGVFNDEKAPPGGSSAGSERLATEGAYTRDQHAISSDGSKAYFTARGPGQLYLRDNPTEPQSPLSEGKCTNPTLACTFHLSASKRTVKGPDPAGAQSSFFRGASADGSKAFFTSSEMLTDDADTGPEQPPAQIGRAKIGESEAEEVKEDLISTHAVGVAVSPDGEHIYWADPSTGNIGRAKLNGDGLPTKPEEPEYIVPGPVEFDVEYELDGAIRHDHVASPSHPRYVAVDGEYVYWTNTADGEEHHGTIGRAKIGSEKGVEVKPQFIVGASDPQGIAVNTEHIYWANKIDFSSIARADLDGTGVLERFCDERLGCSGIPNGKYLGVALSESHIYFTTFEPGPHSSYIISIPLEGGSKDGLIYVGDDKAQGVTVEGSHVYWSMSDVQEGDGKYTPLQPSAIGRAPLSDLSAGTCGGQPTCEIEYLVPVGDLAGLADDGKRLYWSVNGEGGANPGSDLYRYEAATGKLSDLTPDSNPADTNGAEVQGVLGISEDGAYVYFTANGVLAEGASPGSCPLGKCNLYLDHEGQVSFIARLNGGNDRGNWSPQASQGGGGETKTSRMSADGRTLLFLSSEKLSGYENAGKAELYRYRVGDPSPIRCVSCSPTGLAPSEAPSLVSIKPAVLSSNSPTAVLLRNLSADGNRVFFESGEALVPSDTNGAEGCPLYAANSLAVPVCQDVYEWEAKGTGSCGWEAQNGGCLYLISSGKSPEPSFFADASQSGDDVFFFTREQLVGQDEDSLLDVYDARVGGGLASQNEPPPPVPCEGEACKGGASAPPEAASPATPLFSGPGSQKPHRKKAKAKKRKHHKQKRHAKKHGRTHR